MKVKTAQTKLPKMLGSYQLKTLIASGNMGFVYEGYDANGQRPVAIKISRSVEQQANLASRYADMFQREAEIASMLHHPNILEVYDSGQQGNLYYIVFELVKSAQTLKDWIKENDRASLQQAIQWTLQCLRGLAYTHRKGVVHRDIKPANLLLTNEAKIKIADFSIALVTRRDQKVELPEGFVGSPRYMSPEQVQEDQITPQSDLFSLGIIFYELLTGSHPFDARSFSRLIYKLVNVSPADPSEIVPTLPEGVGNAVLKMLAKDPSQRFENADAAIEVIESFIIEQSKPDSFSKQGLVDRCQTLSFFQDWPASDLHELLPYLEWHQAFPETQLHYDDDGFCILMSGRLYYQGYLSLAGETSQSQEVFAGESFLEQEFLSLESSESVNFYCESHIEYAQIKRDQLDAMPSGLAKKVYRSLARALVLKLERERS